MSARNYMSNKELVKDAVYQRRSERHWKYAASCARLEWHRGRCLRWANNCAMRAQASENVLVERIVQQLRRIK